jgi:hypothetical protein
MHEREANHGHSLVGWNISSGHRRVVQVLQM